MTSEDFGGNIILPHRTKHTHFAQYPNIDTPDMPDV